MQSFDELMGMAGPAKVLPDLARGKATHQVTGSAAESGQSFSDVLRESSSSGEQLPPDGKTMPRQSGDQQPTLVQTQGASAADPTYDQDVDASRESLERRNVGPSTQGDTPSSAAAMEVLTHDDESPLVDVNSVSARPQQTDLAKDVDTRPIAFDIAVDPGTRPVDDPTLGAFKPLSTQLESTAPANDSVAQEFSTSSVGDAPGGSLTSGSDEEGQLDLLGVAADYAGTPRTLSLDATQLEARGDAFQSASDGLSVGAALTNVAEPGKALEAAVTSELTLPGMRPLSEAVSQALRGLPAQSDPTAAPNIAAQAAVSTLRENSQGTVLPPGPVSTLSSILNSPGMTLPAAAGEPQVAGLSMSMPGARAGDSSSPQSNPQTAQFGSDPAAVAASASTTTVGGDEKFARERVTSDGGNRAGVSAATTSSIPATSGAGRDGTALSGYGTALSGYGTALGGYQTASPSTVDSTVGHRPGDLVQSMAQATRAAMRGVADGGVQANTARHEELLQTSIRPPSDPSSAYIARAYAPAAPISTGVPSALRSGDSLTPSSWTSRSSLTSSRAGLANAPTSVELQSALLSSSVVDTVVAERVSSANATAQNLAAGTLAPAIVTGVTGQPPLSAGPLSQIQLPAGLAQRIALAAAQGQKSFRVALSPATLGNLDLSIEVRNEQATVVAVASSQAARDALEASMPRLRQLLEGSDLQLDSFTVAQNSSEQSRGDGGREGLANRPVARISEDEADLDSAPLQRLSADNLDGVDLFA